MDVPALALQLLLRDHPSWEPFPVAVVTDDRPQGTVLWANVHARRRRVLPGMTYAAAQNLAAHLRAAVVGPERLEIAASEVHQRLARFSPYIEPSSAEPGVFWVDPSGMEPLFSGLEDWAHRLRNELTAASLRAAVVVGFHRYRCYAIARSIQGVAVLPDPHSESRAAARVPLADLCISPSLREGLHVLGVHTLGRLAGLPASELRARFGEDAARLHALVSDRWAPLLPRPLVDPVTAQFDLEPPDSDMTRLLFMLRGVLHRALNELAGRHQAMSLLRLQLKLDHAPTRDELIEPAQPTLDVPLIIDLVRLRLDAMLLEAAIEGVRVELEGLAADRRQLELFHTHKKRDLEAASRCLARLKASWGAHAVTRARLRAAHLPEASFVWEPTQEVGFPRPTTPPEAVPLCRRMLARPRPLPDRPRHEPSAWLGRRSALLRLHGPYRISGGWWVRMVERDYYYAETQLGELLWIYYDRPRRRWFLHATLD